MSLSLQWLIFKMKHLDCLNHNVSWTKARGLFYWIILTSVSPLTSSYLSSLILIPPCKVRHSLPILTLKGLVRSFDHHWDSNAGLTDWRPPSHPPQPCLSWSGFMLWAYRAETEQEQEKTMNTNQGRGYAKENERERGGRKLNCLTVKHFKCYTFKNELS